jgi:light-regulated signal transduction histidine kinase (bacteriophytochrome)
MQTPELLNCEKEPIHIPGKIQNHGFLIAIDTSSTIISCSDNIHDFLPVNAREILNNSLQIFDKFLQKSDHIDFFSRFIPERVKLDIWEFTNPYSVQFYDQSFYLIISKSANYYLLEFDPVKSYPIADFNGLVRRSLSDILANKQLSGFLSKCAFIMRKIIQYDRVMIYKFHEDGHGEVIAEDKEKSLNPFLGLHYPASDIPKQARELYKVNTVRLIADVDQKTANLISNIIPLNNPLDLTDSVLRAVSPVHIQYLKNMKVASSFSISLIHEGELWGLIACHNYSPRFIDYKGREAASLLGEVISSTLGYQQQEENQEKKHSFKIAVQTLAKQLSQANSIKEALFEKKITLLDAVDSTGSVLFIDNSICTIGETPDELFLENLIQWLNKNMQDQVYFTSRLPLEFPLAQKHKNLASGVLALRLSKEVNDYLIWLRPEVITKINWAGNPDKPTEYDEDQKLKLSPRKSFEKWSQTVTNTSADWGTEDINSALNLKEEVASSIILKAVEIRETNEKINQAYNTLDAFSYTISHDLRTPLTIIKAYGQMLEEDYGSIPEAKTMIDGILSGTNKMNLMIRRILHYSQVGQSEVKPSQINMLKLLSDIRDEALFINSNPSTKIIIKNTPDIYSDEIMAMQVFSNLITNAVKYSSKVDQPRVTIDGKETETYVEYCITDNGVGIKDKDKEKIFELFTRSVDVTDFEGSGVGLSIVRRIMEKHEGKIRVESDGESGSEFYVSFKKSKE